MMGTDDRYRAEEDEAQIEYIRQWRERKQYKKKRRKDFRIEAGWHFKMFWKMLFHSFKGD